MIRLSFLFRRKRENATERPAAGGASPAAPAQRQEKPSRFLGGMPERTQDLRGRQDGERVGFRRPVQG
jgi:hypothetical protein